jgi:hypothetical protein
MTATLLESVCIVLFVSLPACLSAEPAASGKPVRLKIGESTTVEETDLQIGFEDVTGDSRCPKNVQCVWAGEATVVLWVRRGSEEKTTVTLKVPPGGGASTTYRDVTIRIVGLEPQTEAGKRIARTDYVVEVGVGVESH